MIDFKREDIRLALRDFVRTTLQRKGRDPVWLIERSRLSRETVIDRMLARDQSNKPAPRQATLNKLFAALECRFEDFEAYCQGCCADAPAPAELSQLQALVGEMRQLVASGGGSLRTPGCAPLEVVDRPSAGGMPSTGDARSERRQLTVVAIKLVDWDEFSQCLDPEELAELLGAYQGLCSEQLSRFGGGIAETAGAGVLAVFGYPVAREDDAECAVRSALAITAGVGRIGGTRQPVRARCGVATGAMVVGPIFSAAQWARTGPQGGLEHPGITAVGGAPGLAGRLRDIAEPGGVVISDQTRRLVKEMFSYRDLGCAQATGVGGGINSSERIWRVLGERTIRSRFSALRSPALTRLIGREAELERLGALWTQVRAGTGQVAVISGEAGIGKSRLVEAVAQAVVSADCAQISLHCSPHLQSSAFAPVIDHLSGAAGFAIGDSALEKLEKLDRLVPDAMPERGEAMALLVRLLSLDPCDRYPLGPMSPQRQRRRLFQAFAGMLAALTKDRPGLVVFEDLHWIDPSSDELLGVVLRQMRTLPVLVVLTVRAEARAHWEGLKDVSALRLGPLDRSESRDLITEVADRHTLPPEVVSRIVEKADGVPLFIEDVTLDLLQADADWGADGGAQVLRTSVVWRVPDTLHDSLMSRLDRLGGDAKRVVQIGAVIGREFSFQLLTDVTQTGVQGLKDILERLEQADVVRVRRTPAALMYVFKHALLRDAAYASLLKRERRDLHRQVAEVLEGLFSEVCEQTPEVLAYHLEEAGEGARAIHYWVAAGKHSAGGSSFVEALDQLGRALHLTRTLPPSEARAVMEIDILIALGAAHAAHRGFSAHESGTAYLQGLALSRDLADHPRLGQLLSGAGSYHITRAEFAACRALADRCLDYASRQDDRLPYVQGHRLLGGTLFLTGEIVPAVTHLEAALAIYESEPERYRNPDALYVQDHKSTVCCYLGLAHTVIGNLDQGLQSVRSGLAHAEALEQPHTVNFSLTYLAAVHHFRREHMQMLDHARHSHQMALEQGFGTWVGIAQMMIGAALVRLGDAADGMREINDGIAAYSAIDAKTYQPFGISLLAKSLRAVGRHTEAMGAIAKALAIAQTTGERWYLPELLRLRGAINLDMGETQAAIRDLRGSIDLALGLDARFWALRSATLLARMLEDSGQGEEAVAILSPVLKSFTEGLDTSDLHEAKALLRSLRGGEG